MNEDLKVINKIAVKNLFIRLANNNCQAEQENIKKVILNLNVKELKKLKEVGKELIFEEINKVFDKEGEAFNASPMAKIISLQQIKELFHAYVNLGFAIFNENFIHEVIILYNDKTLSQEDKIRRVLKSLSQEIDKVAARKTPLKVTNYAAAERNLAKKMKKIFAIGKRIYFSLTRGQVPKQKDLKTILNIIKGLKAEEIRVARDKGKQLILSWMDSQILTNYWAAEGKELVKSCLNLFDALMDEKMILDSFAMIDIIVKNYEKNGNNFHPNEILEDKQFQNLAQRNMTRIIQLVNELANETQSNSFSQEEKDIVLSKIANQLEVEKENLPADQSQIEKNKPKEEKLEIKKIGSQISSLFASSNNSKPLSWQEVEKTLTTSTSKSGLNGWIIAALVGGAFALGGLIAWFFIRKKKNNNSPVRK